MPGARTRQGSGVLRDMRHVRHFWLASWVNVVALSSRHIYQQLKGAQALAIVREFAMIAAQMVRDVI